MYHNYIRNAFLTGATYTVARSIYYYPKLKKAYKDEKPLYSQYIFETILMLGMMPISLPISIIHDIGFAERRLRGMVITTYDSPMLFCGYAYKADYLSEVNKNVTITR